jgi:polar amino acid transport system substrate-binding protein
VRKDAPSALRDALAEERPQRPVWRGSPAAKLLEDTTFAVVSGTSSENWLRERRATLQIDAQIVPVPDYRTALQLLLDRKVDVVFGERSLVLGAMNYTEYEQLTILDRLFTHELAALALARGDEDFRLLVDASLSRLYATREFAARFAQLGGPLDGKTREFFLWNTLPQ